MVIDHVGIVVKSLEKGIKHWKKVFHYSQKTEIITNTRQRVNVVFLSKKKSLNVKLIEPLEASSPIFNFAQRGGGLHHLCFKCSNVENELDRLKELGLKILAESQPGEAFENEMISFVYAKQGLNIELIDTDKLAGIINEQSKI